MMTREEAGICLSIGARTKQGAKVELRPHRQLDRRSMKQKDTLAAQQRLNSAEVRGQSSRELPHGEPERVWHRREGMECFNLARQ